MVLPISTNGRVRVDRDENLLIQIKFSTRPRRLSPGESRMQNSRLRSRAARRARRRAIGGGAPGSTNQ